jgi:hypothetical protein
MRLIFVFVAGASGTSFGVPDVSICENIPLLKEGPVCRKILSQTAGIVSLSNVLDVLSEKPQGAEPLTLMDELVVQRALSEYLDAVSDDKTYLVNIMETRIHTLFSKYQWDQILPIVENYMSRLSERISDEITKVGAKYKHRLERMVPGAREHLRRSRERLSEAEARVIDSTEFVEDVSNRFEAIRNICESAREYAQANRRISRLSLASSRNLQSEVLKILELVNDASEEEVENLRSKAFSWFMALYDHYSDADIWRACEPGYYRYIQTQEVSEALVKLSTELGPLQELVNRAKIYLHRLEEAIRAKSSSLL